MIGKSHGGGGFLRKHSILPILALLTLAIFISCPAKTPVPDIQEQQQVYNIEDLPLSENLVRHIKSDQEEKYVIYTFYTVGDEQRIHKQYWEGLIVLDDLTLPDQITTNTDNNGNKTIDWRENPLRKSYSKDIYNVNGVLVRRTTINPDGSAVDLVDRTGDGVVNYMEAILPNGDEMIIASDPLGIDYLKDIFEGTNDHCRNSELFRTMSKNMPGCGSSGSGTGGGPGGATNPYDDLMTGLCEGYERRGAEGLNGATRSRRLEDVYIHPPLVTNVEGERTVLQRQEQTFSDGTTITLIITVITNEEGFREESHTTIVNNPDLTSSTTTQGNRTYPDGTSQSYHEQTECESGNCTTTQTTENQPSGDRDTTQWECDSDGNCTDPVVIDEVPGSDTGHPGFEPDHNEAMAELCEAWRQSQEDRPNDVDELNERANEERCSIEPDEADAADGSSLAETCYADIEGRDEIAEMIAAGTCVTASGGTHFDYVTDGSRTCRKNKFFILEHGLLTNGPTGQSQIELCEQDLSCTPGDFN